MGGKCKLCLGDLWKSRSFLTFLLLFSMIDLCLCVPRAFG